MTLYLIKTTDEDRVIAIMDNIQTAKAFLRMEYGSVVTDEAYIEKISEINSHLLWFEAEDVEFLTAEEEL